MILGIGIACGLVGLLAAVFATNEEYADLGSTDALLTLVWLAIPALVTLRWAYGLRDEAFVPPRVPATWAVAALLQVVVYLALAPGSTVRELLPAVLLVALVLLWAVWSGRSY